MLPFAPAVQTLGRAGARQAVGDRAAIGLEAGVLAGPERRARRQRQEMGQEVADLVHQIDAQVLVLDLGVDVHAADHLAPGQHLQVIGQDPVALLVGALLVGPGREGMGRGGHDRHAVPARSFGHGPPQPFELGARGSDLAADRRADLDLRLQQLVGHLLPERLAAVGHELRRGRADQFAAHRVDQEVLLLDAQPQAGSSGRHGGSPAGGRGPVQLEP